MEGSQPKAVRRCRRCGEPASIHLRDWGTSTMLGMVDAGVVSQQDWVCQGCGHVIHLKPWKGRFAVALLVGGPLGGIGVLLMLAGLSQVFEHLAFAIGLFTGGAVVAVACGAAFVGAGRPGFEAWRNPLVDPPPDITLRFTLTEPVRRCRCGELVRCSEVVASRTNGLYTGTEWHYSCDSCQRDFTIESPWGMLTTFLASGIAGAIGAAMLTTAPGQGMGAWACAGVIFLLGPAGLAMVAWRALARLRFPQVTGGGNPSAD